MAELFTDLASSSLASGISAGATTLTVQAGKGGLFPNPGGGDYFTVFLFNKANGNHEFVTCTARSADVFSTVSATTYAYSAGDVVELRPTAAFFTSLASGASSTNIQSGAFLYGVDIGAADAITATMTPTAAGLTPGQEVRIKLNNTNTGGACTLKLDALAATPVVLEGGSNPPAGSLVSGYVHTFVYDGTNFIYRPAGIALGTAGWDARTNQIKNVAAGTASTDAATIGGTEVLSGKTLTSPTINTPVIETPTINTPTITNATADIDTLTGDAIGRGAKVYFAANQPPPTAPLVWDAEMFDTDNIHSTVTNNSRMTIPTGVTKVRFTFQGDMWIPAISGSMTWYTMLIKNGFVSPMRGGGYQTVYRSAHGGGTIAAHQAQMFWASILEVTAGDYFEVYSSSNVSGEYFFDDTTWWEMEIIK